MPDLKYRKYRMPDPKYRKYRVPDLKYRKYGMPDLECRMPDVPGGVGLTTYDGLERCGVRNTAVTSVIQIIMQDF